MTIIQSFIDGESVASAEQYDNIGREKGYEALDRFTATKTVVVRL